VDISFNTNEYITNLPSYLKLSHKGSVCSPNAIILTSERIIIKVLKIDSYDIIFISHRDLVEYHTKRRILFSDIYFKTRSSLGEILVRNIDNDLATDVCNWLDSRLAA
jgi:hypothetical protein